ncbi:MAG: hypothetical protein C4520_08660 [Candidatus Abyssobacteria bacterium SURF_5]|uniref:Phosphoenolpyruvate synthase n=1 Tax=Abyssobacteria bacterium (strain SURF_5) TaxID=2093360 RepID=A0A3A4NTH7_ABYX5|nr:MAG: hypothetical protein C4520_08660 [Candidatus Abyssubacteria bacterium SURF_5]
MFQWYKKYIRERAKEHEQRAERQLDGLRFRYHAFKNLLICNNELLEQMTRLEMYLRDCRRMFPGLAARTDLLLKLCRELVQNLNQVSEGAYGELPPILRAIAVRASTLACKLDPGEQVPLIIPLCDIHLDLIDTVGGKAAPLGTFANQLRLPVPDGFVVTTEACNLLLKKNKLLLRIRDLLRNLNSENFRQVEAVSLEVQDMILKAEIPEELRDPLERSFQQLLQASSSKAIAVRSSAVPEDGQHSFAGQFTTVLNVISVEAALTAYKEVIASNFNATSLMYRLHRQMGLREADMAVLCLAMAPARSAGILYTVDPNDPDGERMVLCSAWGLGEYLVNGRLPADILHVSRLDLKRFEPVQLARKELKLVCDPDRGGTREEPVPTCDSLRLSINENEMRTLCEYGLKIEKYLGYPVDIEWAITQVGDIIVLQGRRLQLRSGGREYSQTALERLKPLVAKGITASKGQCSGKTAIIAHQREIDSIEPGSIVVARESFLSLANRVSFIRGIVLEKGNPLEHLACIAREYRIPMIVGAANITEMLANGQSITLDADECTIYEGEADLLNQSAAVFPATREEAEASIPDLKEFRHLIFSLNLLDVRDPNFQMSSCRSVHDVVRFCHEQGIQTMFQVNDGEYVKNKSYVSRLDNPIPFHVDIINLGGGFAVSGHPRKVKIEEITSIPFLALWKGISHKGIKWSGPPPRVNLGAFSSVLGNTAIDAARSGRPLGSRNYAMISRDYMNLNSRLAYHFALVDALCSYNSAENYINFRFKGGGTNLQRRRRRVIFLARVLESLGFFAHVDDDLLNAFIKDLQLRQMEEKLDMVGRLLGCARLLDMAMEDEASMEWFIHAFLSGNYAFAPEFEGEESKT